MDRRYFWTDSSTVRNWIRATAAFYQTFVSHRIGEIQTLTESLEWRFVPGKLNPDGATRSMADCKALHLDWLDGPDFLYASETHWPADLPWMLVKEEIRVSRVHHSQSAEVAFDWSTVEITTDTLHEFLQLTPSNKELLKLAQRESYEEEFECMDRGRNLCSSS